MPGLSLEMIKVGVENALEMSGMIGNPADLLPDDMGLKDNDYWFPDEMSSLFHAVAQLYGPADLWVRLWRAIAQQQLESIAAYRKGNGDYEFPTDHQDVAVYAQYSEDRQQWVLAIGAPGWTS